MAVLLVLGGCKSSAPELGMDAKTFQSVIETLCAPEMEGRDAGTAGLALARDFMVDHFVSAGLEPAFVINGEPSYTQPFNLPIGTAADGEPIVARIENVGGLLPGNGDLADEVVVIGAHYDHVGFGDIGARDKKRKGELHPGADDNASGTAGVLMLAWQFAQMKADPNQPRRTILFTGFAGEERGLHGARYMTRHPDQWAFNKDRISGMINLDMVGRLRNGELYVFADASGKQWREWTNAANESVGLNLKWDVRAPGASDHALFIAAGVPAVFFNTWLHPDYHTPDDTPDKINAEGGAQVLALVAGLLERTATEQDRLVYVAPEPRKPRPYLGVMIAEHERGVKLESIAPNGPMQKAGAKADDILLSIGGETIKTPGALRSYLSKAKSGVEVPVVLLRDGGEITLTVRLDIRR